MKWNQFIRRLVVFFMCYVRSLFGFVFTEFRYAFVLNKHYHLLYSWLVCWCRDILLFIVCGYILLLAFFYVLFFSFSYVLFNELACRLVWFGLWQCAPSPQRIHINIMGEKWRMEKNKAQQSAFKIWTITCIWNKLMKNYQFIQ